MKLISCHIDNFGVLRNFDMIFDEGLNIIMRDNGWGKSTLAAFLKAMLYGYDQKRGADMSVSERERYLPWQGGKYGGSLIFEKGGVQYRVVRSFGKEPQSDLTELYELESGKPVQNVRNIGEWLFRLDVDAFKRCAFINQDLLDPDSSGQGLNSRLNSMLLGEANDAGGYDAALRNLTQRIEDYEKKENRGYIGEIQKKIDDLMIKQKSAEKNIRSVEKWRRELEKLDIRLAQEGKTIAELRKKLEAHNAERKERAAVLKLYSQLREGRKELDEKISGLLDISGGSIPELSEVQAMKQSCGEIERVSETLRKIQEQADRKAAEIRAQYDALTAEKDGLERELELISAEGAVPDEEELQTVRRGRAEIIRVSEALETLTAQQEKKKAEFLKKQDELLRQKNEWKEKLDSLLLAGGIPDEEEIRAIRRDTGELSHVKQSLDALMQEAQEKAEKLRGRHSELLERQASLEIEYNAAFAGLGDYPPSISEINDAKKIVAQMTAVKEDAENIKAGVARLGERVSSVEKRYPVKIPAAEEISYILKTCGEADKTALEIKEKENSPVFLDAKKRKEELLVYFDEELPEADVLTKTESDISAARDLEKEAAELIKQASSERSKLNKIDVAMERIEAENKTPFTLVRPKPTAGILCMVGAIAAAVCGLILTPIVYAAAALLLVIGIILLVRTSKRKREYETKRIEYNERVRIAGEECDRLKDEHNRLSKIIRQKKSEAQAKQDKADNIYNEAVACIAEWIPFASKENLEQSCAELKANLRELNNVQKTIDSFEEELEEQRNRLEVLNYELDAKLTLLPSDTEKMPVGERADAALADIDVISRLKAEQKEREEQLSERNGRLRRLAESVSGILERCGLNADNAAAMLPEYEKRLLVAGEAGRRLEEHRSVVFDFERQNAQALSGNPEFAPDSPESRLRRQADELTAGVQAILDKYSCESDEIETWLDMSEKRAFFREKIYQRQREVNKQLEDLKAANSEFLSEKRIAPDSAEGKLRSQLSDLEQKVGAVLGRYGVSDGAVDEWLNASEKRLDEKSGTERRLSAAGKRIADFRSANRAVLDGTELSSDHAAVNMKARLQKLTKEAAAFSEKYGFSGGKELSGQLDAVEEQAAAYEEFCSQREAYAVQIRDFEAKHRATLKKQGGERENADYESLKLQLMEYENNRELMLKERAQTESNIRHADEELSSYNTTAQRLKTLCEEKQEAQKSLYVLKKSVEFLKKAKESLTSRYVGQIEKSFNQYLSGWIMEKDLRGVVDDDLNVMIEKDGDQHSASGYSTGYTDIIDFCMRMALIDSLFEEERPFIIMDDPFVNLDEERLEYAMSLLKAMSSETQMIYFACHPVRAREYENDAAFTGRIKHIKPSAGQTARAPAVRKAEYLLRPEDAILPRGSSRRITGGIFSLEFVPEPALTDDSEFEVFFVDEAERVICDKQRLSYSEGELMPEKVRFCLNTGKASGKVYTLIIRNAASAENEAVRKIPYSAAAAVYAEAGF